MKSLAFSLVSILLATASAAHATSEQSLPLGVTITATCLTVTKAENNATQNYQWVQATRLPNLAACQAFEASLKARILASGGDTKLVPTRVDADCSCDRTIDRLRTKFYDTEVVE